MTHRIPPTMDEVDHMMPLEVERKPTALVCEGCGPTDHIERDGLCFWCFGKRAAGRQPATPLDVVEFVTLIRDNPGFWAWDFPLKYLSVCIDTRAGANWRLKDRDGNRIEPERVYAAIEQQKRRNPSQPQEPK